MNTLFRAITLSASLGTAPVSTLAADEQTVDGFCQEVQHRSAIIQNNSAKAESEPTINISSQAPQVSPEYVRTVLGKIEQMARIIQYWDAHCPKDGVTTWEMGLVYETVTELEISREDLEDQLKKNNSEFYKKLFKQYNQFVRGAYGNFSTRSSYPSIDAKTGGKRFFEAKDEIKKIENRIAQGAQNPRDGIVHIYRLFQTEGTPYVLESQEPWF